MAGIKDNKAPLDALSPIARKKRGLCVATRAGVLFLFYPLLRRKAAARQTLAALAEQLAFPGRWAEIQSANSCPDQPSARVCAFYLLRYYVFVLAITRVLRISRKALEHCTYIHVGRGFISPRRVGLLHFAAINGALFARCTHTDGGALAGSVEMRLFFIVYTLEELTSSADVRVRSLPEEGDICRQESCVRWMLVDSLPSGKVSQFFEGNTKFCENRVSKIFLI